MTQKSQTQEEAHEARRILYDGLPTGQLRYDSDFHPADIQQYFRERYAEIDDPERFESENKLDFVMKKIRLPTFSGYCASLGISRSTARKWGEKYPEYELALDICKGLQHDMIVSLAACGAYNPNFAALMMKNQHEWQDKIETTSRGTINLHFDAQDEDA